MPTIRKWSRHGNIKNNNLTQTKGVSKKEERNINFFFGTAFSLKLIFNNKIYY